MFHLVDYRTAVRVDPPRRLGYQPSLDGLRCIAVILVLALHAVAFLLPATLQGHLQGAGIGVNIFFALSGFLITSLLLQEEHATGGIRVGAFYARRALRLLPALVALLVANSTIVLSLGHADLRETLLSDAAAVFYVVNWVKTLGPDVVAGLGHTWTLAVEEQFYLVWPWLLILALRRRMSARGMAVVLVVGIVLSAAIRGLLWAGADGDWESVGFRTDANADGLLAGALLAVAWRNRWSLAWRSAPIVAALFLSTVVLFLGDHEDFMMFGGFTAVAIASVLLIAGVLNESPMRNATMARVLRVPIATHVGKISYGLYLWHVPMYNLAASDLHLHPALKPVVGVALAFAAAELSMALIERPFLRLKTRLGEQKLLTGLRMTL